MNFGLVPITLHMFARALNNGAVLLSYFICMADYHVQEHLYLQHIDNAWLKQLAMYKVTLSWCYLYAVVVENFEPTLNCFYK